MEKSLSALMQHGFEKKSNADISRKFLHFHSIIPLSAGKKFTTLFINSGINCKIKKNSTSLSRSRDIYADMF